MKIFVEMIAYNAEPLIGAAIKSTYDYVDKIYVADGSAYGPSTDKTAEIALSCGPKVEVIRGKFMRYDGMWDESLQRAVCLERMERHEDNWLIFQDSDEVWPAEQIERLIGYLTKQPPEVCYCTYVWMNFWLNPHQIITGGPFDLRRPDMASRLAPVNRTPWNAPRTDFPDVYYHHYSHALPKEKRDWKVYEYWRRGDYKEHKRLGIVGEPEWTEEEWLTFKKWHDENWYENPTMPGIKIEPFTGEHHPEVKKISQQIWGEQL